MVLGVVASLSRTAILFLCLVVGQTYFLLYLRQPKLPLKWLLSAFIGLIVAILILMAFQEPIDRLVRSLDIPFVSRAFTIGTLSARLNSWTNVVTDARYWTPLGYGFGVSISTLRSKYNLVFDLLSHDEYTGILLEQGILGLICFLGFFGSWIRQSYRHVYFQRNFKLRFAGMVMLALCSTTLITGLLGTMLKVSPINVYFWLFAGILARSPLFANWARPTTSAGRLTLTNSSAVSIAKHGNELA
jgi:O-antigen ligase